VLGILYSVLSAFTFSLNMALVRRGVTTATPGQAALVTVVMGVPLFLVAALATGQLLEWDAIDAGGYWLLAVAGVIHFVIGRYGNYRGLRAIGANRMQVMQTLSIPVTIIVAMWWLDEQVTGLMWAGIVLIMIGPLIMTQRRGPQPARTADGFTPKMAEGFFWGLVASFGYGASPLLVRAALEGNNLGIYGGFVSYLAAALVLIAYTLIAPGKRVEAKAIDRGALRLFMTGTVSVFLAQLFRYMALGIAPVSLVTPLMRTGSLFTLGLSWGMNRSMESFTLPVLTGVALSIAGAVLLAL
jgi:drug/metabolite transporter (DMT)-like permease